MAAPAVKSGVEGDVHLERRRQQVVCLLGIRAELSSPRHVLHPEPRMKYTHVHPPVTTAEDWGSDEEGGRPMPGGTRVSFRK